MMKEKEAYKKIVETLRRSEAGLEDKEQLKARISRAIKARSAKQDPADRILRLLFGWVDILWMRWSVSALALVLVASFLVQQVGVSQRMVRMEKQLIHIESRQVEEPESSGYSQQVLLRLYTRSQSDSVTVSRADLDKLLQQYQQMKEKSNSLEL